MPLIHTRQFRIRHYECDAYGHLNNVNYLRYMQETAFDASAVRHYTITRVADQTLIARSHSLYAWVDVHNGKPVRILPEFLDDFRPNIAASD